MDRVISHFTEHIIRACSQIENTDQLLGLSNGQVEIIDHYERQLVELFKLRYPEIAKESSEYRALLFDFIDSNNSKIKGNWIFLPWLNKWIRVLEEEAFTEVITSRNKLKVTDEEQKILREKKILIIGLSVGQTAAVCLAMENIGQVIRLADFDTLDLSNLNRLRGGIHEIGEKKTRLAARRIIEMNPYSRIELAEEGATAENLPVLLKDVDILLEECDSLPIKILSRLYAREMRIPVIMDTSDRGMLDVERFDLEPERPLFHGLAGDLNLNTLKSLNRESGMKLMMSIVDFPNISDRLKLSYSEMGKSLVSWPQLASEVTAGGAHATEAARRILIGEEIESGRYYIELNKTSVD